MYHVVLRSPRDIKRISMERRIPNGGNSHMKLSSSSSVSADTTNYFTLPGSGGMLNKRNYWEYLRLMSCYEFRNELEGIKIEMGCC